MKTYGNRQINSALRCACYFRERARRAASPEGRHFYRGWMRAHAIEAARRIQLLRAASGVVEPAAV